jgi:predicted lipoprotein with Yx(FWY)xxD motif
MRKSGWAVAAGIGSLLLLTACGGSSSPSSSAGSSASASASSSAPNGQPSTAIGGIQPGDLVLIVENTGAGYVLATANQVVVYTYGNDKKGGPPTCTGSCAANWPALTVQNKPLVVVGDTLPAKLGTIATADGNKQITYDGMPLYTFKGAGPYSVAGNGVEGLWHVVKLSASDISGG